MLEIEPFEGTLVLCRLLSMLTGLSQVLARWVLSLCKGSHIESGLSHMKRPIWHACFAEPTYGRRL